MAKRLAEWMRGWRLWSWRSATVALFVVYVLLGFLLLPVIVRNMIVDNGRAMTGREVGLRSVQFNPFTLALTLEGLRLPDVRDSSLLTVERVYANVQVSSLFRWAVTLKELRVEDPRIDLRRYEDGTVNVVTLIDEIQSRMPSGDETATAEAERALPRLVFDRILVSGAQVEIEDHVPAQPLRHRIGPSVLELTGVSTLAGRKGHNEFVIGLEAGGTIRVSGNVVVEPLRLEGDIAVEKVMLNSLWPFLKPYFEFDVMEGEASGQFHYEIAMEEALRAQISGLEYQIDGLSLEPRDSSTRILDLDSVAIDGGHVAWPSGEYGAEAVRVDGARVFTWLEPDGRLSLESLVPVDTRKQVVEIYHQVQEAATWTARVGRIELTDAEVGFEDRSFADPPAFAGQASLVVTNMTTTTGSHWGINASLSLGGESSLSLEGLFGPIPLNAEVEVAVSGLDLHPFQPYVGRLAPLEVLDGRFRAAGKVVYRAPGEEPRATFTGEVGIDTLEVRETAMGSPLLRWADLTLRGVSANQAPQSLSVEEVTVNEASLDLLMTEAGRLNLMEMLAAMRDRTGEVGPGAVDEPAGAKVREAKRGLPPVSVGRLQLNGCSGAFTDGSMEPAFTLGLDDVNGTIEHYNSTAIVGADVDLEGIVRSGGSVDLQGRMDLFDPGRLTEVTLALREIAMPPVSPLAVHHVGYPVEQGEARFDFVYQILGNHVKGRNSIVTQNLRFGDKDKSGGGLNLPVKLGVSLLTDKNGRITLEFPIEGNLEDETFGLHRAVVAAVKEVTSEVVKSPFRLLGRLGGGKDTDDYQSVEFRPGSADLDPDAKIRLKTLADGMAQRPDLVLQVQGVWSPQLDSRALQEASFEALVAGDPSAGGDATRPTLARLESLYREVTSTEELESVRNAYQTTAGAAIGGRALDETLYYRDLRDRLISLQPVAQEMLQALGSERAASVRAFLVDGAGVDPARVRSSGQVAADKVKSADRVSLELEVAAGG